MVVISVSFHDPNICVLGQQQQGMADPYGQTAPAAVPVRRWVYVHAVTALWLWHFIQKFAYCYVF